MLVWRVVLSFSCLLGFCVCCTVACEFGFIRFADKCWIVIAGLCMLCLCL